MGANLSVIDFTFEFLSDNSHSSSTHYKNLTNLMNGDEEEDDKAMEQLVKKFTLNMDADIKKHIDNGNINLVTIANYNNLLKRLDMDKDCPEENIFIENKPNINGMILFIMLTTTLSKDSGLNDTIREKVVNMFQKRDISELYTEYVELFEPFMLNVIGDQEEVTKAINNMCNTMGEVGKMVDEYVEQKKLAIFISTLISEYITTFSDVSQLKYGNTCSICIEDFKKGDMIFTLPCQHTFHLACIDFNSMFISCPNCRGVSIEHKQFYDNLNKCKDELARFQNSSFKKQCDSIIKKANDIVTNNPKKNK